MTYKPNHPQFLLAYQFDAQTGRYVNVTLAHINPAESLGIEAKYFVEDDSTLDPVPHVAPEGKDWYRKGGQSGEWLLVDDTDAMTWYDAATGQSVAPPKFGEPVPTTITSIAPTPAGGEVIVGFDAKAKKWTYRKSLAGTVVYNTSDHTERVLSVDDIEVPVGYTSLKPESAAYDYDSQAVQWVLNKDKQAELDAAARKAAVPHVVTMRQAKLALLQAGLLDEVDAAIAAEPTPKAIKIEWEYASEVRRDWVNTLGFAAMLGMTDELLDDLFVLAAGL